MPRPPRVMLVEDHAMVAMATVELLEELDCHVVGPAPTVSAAEALARAEHVDLALVDVSLPDGSGLELAERLAGAGVSCAILSAHPRPSDATGFAGTVTWIDKMSADAAIRRLLARRPAPEGSSERAAVDAHEGSRGPGR